MWHLYPPPWTFIYQATINQSRVLSVWETLTSLQTRRSLRHIFQPPSTATLFNCKQTVHRRWRRGSVADRRFTALVGWRRRAARMLCYVVFIPQFLASSVYLCPQYPTELNCLFIVSWLFVSASNKHIKKIRSLSYDLRALWSFRGVLDVFFVQCTVSKQYHVAISVKRSELIL